MLLVLGLETLCEALSQKVVRDCVEKEVETPVLFLQTCSRVSCVVVTAKGTNRASVMKQILQFVAAWSNIVAYGPLPLHGMITHRIMCRFSSSVSFFIHRIKSCYHSSSVFNLLTRPGCDI
jgi:hypothetical protein